MIRLFFIKNKLKNKNLMSNNDEKILEKYKKIAQKEKQEIIQELKTNIEKGLTNKEAEQKLEEDGENVVVKDDKHSWPYFFINSFKDKFILILVVLAIINKFVGDDTLGTVIILAIGFVSAMIKFAQNYSTYKFNRKLKSEMFSTATVVRNGKEQTIRTEKVVKGDIIHLNAGSIIPADVMIIENKDLFLNQSVFTGESAPIEKTDKFNNSNEIFSISNICLMGTSVISGDATAIVINTGFSTYLGSMGKQIDNKRETTNFEKGMNGITKLLIKLIIVCPALLGSFPYNIDTSAAAAITTTYTYPIRIYTPHLSVDVLIPLLFVLCTPTFKLDPGCSPALKSSPYELSAHPPFNDASIETKLSQFKPTLIGIFTFNLPISMPIFASKLTPSLLHVTPNDVGIPNLFFFPKSMLGIFKLYD